MSKVFSHMVMSLDGFIADPNDGIEELFGWYVEGDVKVPSLNKDIQYQVDANSAELIREYTDVTGALVCGRHLFEVAKGWGDSHPASPAFVVVTHNRPDDADSWKTASFADSVESGMALAKQIAADKDVVVASPSVAQQALDLGLLDEVHISLAPVLLGEGIPYFTNLTRAPHRFEDPDVVQGKRATHLRYVVRR